MTDPSNTTSDEDTTDQEGADQVAEGDRDPLSTDDGLAEGSEGIPQIADRDAPSGSDQLYEEGDDGCVTDRVAVDQAVSAPDLQVDSDGRDPLVDAADDDESAGGEPAAETGKVT